MIFSPTFKGHRKHTPTIETSLVIFVACLYIIGFCVYSFAHIKKLQSDERVNDFNYYGSRRSLISNVNQNHQTAPTAERVQQKNLIVMTQNNQQYNWCHWLKTNQPSLPAHSNTKVYSKMLTMFQFIKDANVPYQLAFGSLLGAIRHAGIIPNDGDTDVRVMLSQSDERFKHCITEHDYVVTLAWILYNLTIDKPDLYGDFTIIKNAYSGESYIL